MAIFDDSDVDINCNHLFLRFIIWIYMTNHIHWTDVQQDFRKAVVFNGAGMAPLLFMM